MPNNKILQGNFDQQKDAHRGWVVGHFMDSTSPLCTTDLEVKWSRHIKGEKKETVAKNQTAKTIFILISGSFKFTFPDTDEEITVNQQSDYLFYPPGVYHIWEALEDSLVMNIRWPSVPNDQKKII